MPMPVGGRLGRSSRFLVEYDYRDGLDRNGLPIFRSGQIPTFGRGGTINAATAVDRNGRFYTAGPVQPRFNHRYNVATGLHEPSGLVLEGTRGNLCTFSQTLTSWGIANTGTTVDNALTLGVAALSLLTDSDGAASYYRQSASLQFATGGVARALSFKVKKGSSTESLIRLRDDVAGSDRLYLTLTWNGTVPVCNFASGSLDATEPLRDGAYRLYVRTNAMVAAATNHTVRVHPCATAANTGTLYFGSVQVEDAGSSSSYIPTGAAAITRTADTFALTYRGLPGAMSVLIDYDDFGTSLGGSTTGLWSIGDSVAESLYAYSSVIFHRNAVDVVSIPGGAPAYGNRIQLLGVLADTGIVTGSQAINGGPLNVGAPSAATALSAAFSSTNLRIGARSSGTPGFINLRAFRIAAGNRAFDFMTAGT